MPGHRKIQSCLLIVLAVVGCRSSELNVVRQKRVNMQPIIDERIANATLERMPKILPETHYAAARLLEEQGQMSKAIVQYRKAIAVNHKYVAAYHRLGMLLSKVGRHEEAVTILNKAVALKPDEAILRNNLGFELMFLERWAQARENFTKAIEFNPRLVRAHVNLGLVLSKLGEFDRALTSFQAVLPEADAYYNLGLMYRGQKRYEDAVRAFEHVLKCNPKFTAAQMQLAELIGYVESPEEKIAGRNPEVDIEPAPELPAAIDRIIDVATHTHHGVNANRDVVVITQPGEHQSGSYSIESTAAKKTPARQVTNHQEQNFTRDNTVDARAVEVVASTKQDKLTQVQNRVVNAETDPAKEEWESVFDELAHLYADHKQESKNNGHTPDEKTQLAMVFTPQDVAEWVSDNITGEDTGEPLPVLSPRVSRVTPRTFSGVSPVREVNEFLPENSIYDVDSSDGVTAMKGLSLDEPEDKRQTSANRPAVIPDTLDWFRGQLSIVRNEITCLELQREEREMPVLMDLDIHEPVMTTPPTTTNRSILVNDQEQESKPRTKKSKPITDAGLKSIDPMRERMESDQDARSSFGEFAEIIDLVFGREKPKGDLDELTAIVMNRLDGWEDADREQHAMVKPVDPTKEWLLNEFGDTAQWLFQIEPGQSADSTGLDKGKEDAGSVSTIEKIIKSTRAFVLGGGTE